MTSDEILNAYKAGKQIERQKKDSLFDDWENIVVPVWDWTKYNYRVNPISLKYDDGKKYRCTFKEDWVADRTDYPEMIYPNATLEMIFCKLPHQFAFVYAKQYESYTVKIDCWYYFKEDNFSQIVEVKEDKIEKV